MRVDRTDPEQLALRTRHRLSRHSWGPQRLQPTRQHALLPHGLRDEGPDGSVSRTQGGVAIPLARRGHGSKSPPGSSNTPRLQTAPPRIQTAPTSTPPRHPRAKHLEHPTNHPHETRNAKRAHPHPIPPKYPSTQDRGNLRSLTAALQTTFTIWVRGRQAK
jgi:hypothetical protein